MSAYCRETELRNVQQNDLYKLAVILDDNDYWKKLMESIPRDINNKSHACISSTSYDDKDGRKYTNDHIRLIENAFKRTGESRLCPQILFDEWGSSGKKHERPTLGVLLHLLLKANLIRAADYVAENLLGESKPPRPCDGPCAEITCELPSTIFGDICEMANDSQNYPDTELLQQNALIGSSFMDNNKDYYTKYRDPIEKMFAPAIASANENGKAPKPPPRSQKSKIMKQKLIQRKQQNHSVIQCTDYFESTANTSNCTDIFTTNKNETTQEHSKPSEVNSIDNLPKISLLMDADSKRDNVTASHDSIPNLSFLIGNSIEISKTSEENSSIANNSTESTSDIENTAQTSHDLPAISALNLNGEKDAISSKNCDSVANVPSVALNFDRNVQTSDKLGNTNCVDGQAKRDSYLQLDGGDSDNSYIDDGDDVDVDIEDDDADVPNLSFFNDSSLTSVTNTSGENSFEQNNDSRPTSTDTMPPLISECIPTIN